MRQLYAGRALFLAPKYNSAFTMEQTRMSPIEIAANRVADAKFR